MLDMTKDTHGGIVADGLSVGGPPVVLKAETIDKCSFTSGQVTDEKTLTVFPSLHMSGSEPFEDPSWMFSESKPERRLSGNLQMT